MNPAPLTAHAKAPACALVALLALASCSGSPPTLGGGQDLQGPGPARAGPPASPGLGPVLRLLLAARGAGDVVRERELVRKRGIELRAGRVLVQIEAAGGDATAIHDALLARWGATLRVRGTSVLDAWVPVASLAGLAASPEVARIELPRRPITTLGSIQSQGVTLIDADKIQCAGVEGKGVKVAMMDTSFAGLTDGNPEIGTLSQVPDQSGNVHGTACAEILFDVAPAVVLHPVKVGSLADLQKLVASLPASGTTVISDSLAWTSESFSDGTGPLCEAVDAAVQAKVAWITSAGNNANGGFYLGSFTDSDGDGRHEFAPGDELNDLSLQAGTEITIYLDWDDYPTSDQDFDLLLYQQQGTDWVLVESSTLVQDGTARPAETVAYTVPSGGTYGVAVERVQATKPAMPFRLFLFPAPGPSFEHWQADRSLLDPAPCANAVAVGAVPYSTYDKDAVWSASARGPTMDGRIKPDLVAPSAVSTKAFNTFHGTSASAPHVAGAVALYIQAAKVDALAASQLMLSDVEPMGSTVPNNDSGRGRLSLDASRAGWECKAGSSGDCPTSCGSTGQGVCGTSCSWTCTPPLEACNDVDDDCDGQVDEELQCDPNATASCTTPCGSNGEQRCGADCLWRACVPPVETCNGADDDCDGKVDEDLTCDEGCSCALGRARTGNGELLGLLLLLALLLYRCRRRCR